MDFDATSLFPLTLWDEKTVGLKKESCYAVTPDVNNEIVGKIKTQTFAQGSAILKVL